MIFTYQCEKCKKSFDCDFSIGQAPRTVSCPSCGYMGKRVYSGMSISVKIDGRTHGSTFGEQMKNKNKNAAERMKGRKPPVRLKAYDYGNGDIRAVS